MIHLSVKLSVDPGINNNFEKCIMKLFNSKHKEGMSRPIKNIAAMEQSDMSSWCVQWWIKTSWSL